MMYRFIPRKMTGGTRGSDWRVYDKQNGSYPYQTPELGTVLQDQGEAAIKAECDRLTEAFGGMKAPSGPKAGRSAGRGSSRGKAAGGDPDEPDAEDSDA